MGTYELTGKIYKHLEHSPAYATEETPGVYADVDSIVDSITGGSVYLHSNVQEERFVGAQVDRVPGIIRAGVNDLTFSVRSYHFIRHAIRGSGTWGYMAELPSLSLLCGSYSATSDCDQVRLWGCKFDTLELSQEYNEDGAPLSATATLIGLGGAMPGGAIATYVAPEAPPAWTQRHRKLSWMSGGALKINLGGGAKEYRIRSWRLSIRNNLQLVTYGDVVYDAARISQSTNYLREATEVREGEEEVEFEATIETPFYWGTLNIDDPTSLTHSLGTFGATITYTDADGSVTNGDDVLKFTLSNFVVDNDHGFNYEYDAADAGGDPIRVFTVRGRKNNLKTQSVAITNV